MNPKRKVFGDEIILFKLGEFEVFGVPEFSVVNPNKPVILKISEELQNLWHPNLVGKWHIQSLQIARSHWGSGELVTMVIRNLVPLVMLTWRIIPVSKWLITMVIVSPLRIGLFPFQMTFLWLINGGDPKYLHPLGWSSK